MQYETVLGLRKEHTFDEVRRYIQADPDTIQYPERKGLFLTKSHIYNAVEQAMRNYGDEAILDQARYRKTDDTAPYVPPKKRKPKPPQDDPMDDDAPDPRDTRMDDQITGPSSPPPPPPG